MCQAIGCTRPRHGRHKLCSVHSWKLWRWGNIYEPRHRKPGSHPCGQGTITPDGYHRVCMNGKVFLVHRLIWALHHGTPAKGFDVHHVDNDGLHNDIRNLMSLTKSRHTALHKER